MKNVKVIDHPLIKSKLTIMRMKDTPTKLFKELLDEISKLMAYELFSDLKLKTFEIETPLSKTKGYKLANDVLLFPILRAGLGMVDGIRSLVPNCKIGHIGIYRDEKKLTPKEYFFKKPENIKDSYIVVLDPMLATGCSSEYAINKLKSHNIKNINLLLLVASPSGIKYIVKKFPDVNIYVAAIDEKLNDKGYIIPGLGDAGDRIFGTK